MFKALWVNAKSILYTLAAISLLIAVCAGGMVALILALIVGVFMGFKRLQD